MRVMISGSRDWDNPFMIKAVLAKYAPMHDTEDVVVITGGAPGADRIAENIARKYFEFIVLSVPARWSKYGDAAGPIRNQKMLDEYKPDILHAFHKNNSPGTQDMISRATAMNIPVQIHKWST